MGKIAMILGLLFIAMLVACGSGNEVYNGPEPYYPATAPNYGTTEPATEQPTYDIGESIVCEAYLPPSTGRIFLYGEIHGCPIHMARQLESWGRYYHDYGMRHLFIESAYFTAQFLNMWMQADDDTILYEVFNDWRGSAAHTPYKLDFYRTIKRDFPETIFHGTDVGHQRSTTGARFRLYLEENGLQYTDTYHRTLENIEQYWQFRNAGYSHAVRSHYMPLNFIREFDKLADQDIMAIHGGAHVLFGDFGSYDVPTLATILRKRYGNALQTIEMWHEIQREIWLAGLIQEPLRVDTITIDGIDFEASFFGNDGVTFTNYRGQDVIGREFWRLENAYEHFSNKPLTGDVLPFNNFPMYVEVGQVFIVDIVFDDGTANRTLRRSSGMYWNGLAVTEELVLYE